MAVSEGEIGRFTSERSGLEEMSIPGLLRRVMAFSPLVLEQSAKPYLSTLTKPVYRRAHDSATPSRIPPGCKRTFACPPWSWTEPRRDSHASALLFPANPRLERRRSFR